MCHSGRSLLSLMRVFIFLEVALTDTQNSAFCSWSDFWNIQPKNRERFYPAVYNFQWSVCRQICPWGKALSHGGHKVVVTVLHHVLHHGHHWQTGTALGNLFKNTHLGSDCSQEQMSRSAEQSTWRPLGWFVSTLFAPPWGHGEKVRTPQRIIW